MRTEININADLDELLERIAIMLEGSEQGKIYIFKKSRKVFLVVKEDE